MTDWTVVFLGVIAGATLIMALIQVGACIGAVIALKRVTALTERVEQQVRPLLTRIDEFTEEAKGAVSTTAAGIQHIQDRLGLLADHVERTVGTVQSGVLAPAREGAALLAGARAIVRAFKRTNGGEPPDMRGL